ncbi:MAG: serine/threonine protein kinase [Planctomycetia bacterium]|nr:serine/threonine protein kinase [Planctomycetia bacterium]
MPSEPHPVNNTASEATRLRCTRCGTPVRAVGWRPGMAATCKKCGAPLAPAEAASESSAETVQTVRPAPPPDPLLGRTLGGCRIKRKIGSGGMGAVYEALHLGLDKKVAIKILPPEFTSHATALERFQREARAAARLEHPNIVQVLNVGNEGGYNFIVMQFVEGESLGKLVSRRGALPWQEALKFVRDAARGLASAHAAGVIHRDIKPDNILVAKDGVAKVADFGLARTMDSGVSLSTTGQIMGTPDYMSPEQAQAQKIDGRGDIYSLGATFYFLLSGKKPFHAETPLAIIMKHVSEPPAPLRDANPGVPQAVANVISRMMAKRPDDRFPDCPSLVAALDELERGGTPVSSGMLPSVPAPGGATQVVLPAASNARAFAFFGAGAAAVVLLAVVFVMVVRSGRTGTKSPGGGPSPGNQGASAGTPAPEKQVLDLYRSLADAVESRRWADARAALASLSAFASTEAYRAVQADVDAHAARIRAHDERVAAGTIEDLPGGGERAIFEFDSPDADLDMRNWMKGLRAPEKGVLVGMGIVQPSEPVAIKDGTLRARLKFIERKERVKLPDRNKPVKGILEDWTRPVAGFGFRLQEDGTGWGAGIEDGEADRAKAVVALMTGGKPAVKPENMKAVDIASPGEEYFELWISFRGDRIAVGIGERELLATTDARGLKAGNIIFFARGTGVRIDRVVIERAP